MLILNGFVCVCLQQVDACVIDVARLLQKLVHEEQPVRGGVTGKAPKGGVKGMGINTLLPLGGLGTPQEDVKEERQGAVRKKIVPPADVLASVKSLLEALRGSGNLVAVCSHVFLKKCHESRTRAPGN